MVNKLELNNCLMRMRPVVLKAKVKTMLKLNRKIKSMKHGKEKNPEKPGNAKLDMKIKKFEEELVLLKEMDKVDNVKKVFTFSGNFMGVMANPSSSVLDRAIAKLIFNSEPLRDTMKKLKEQFKLKDDDEEWKAELLTIRKMKKQKLKKEGVTAESPKKVKKAKKETSKEQEDESEVKPIKKQKKEKKAPKEAALKTESATEESPKKKKNAKKTVSGDDGDAEVPKSPKKAKKQDKSDKVLQINEKSKKINQKAKNLLNKKKGKDFKKNFNGDKKPQFAGKGPGKPPGNAPGKPPGKAPGKPPGKAGKPLQNGSGDKTQKDHPSWEAKKKQKPSIQKFQGKKIKFTE